jgi:hypothetical protein
VKNKSALSDKSTIGKDLEITTKIATYTVLHSFATQLMNSEQASLNYIVGGGADNTKYELKSNAI